MKNTSIENTNIIDTKASGETIKYKVRTDASKIFEMFSDHIYNDRIAAVIRELSCNAVDAHIEAENEETPFYVHLPTYNEPYFSVRDYGTGLSEEDILTTYTTLGESTRDTSDDFVGAFGVGAYSAFAYCQNEKFHTISYQKGLKTTWINSKDERGLPQIDLVNKEATDEPDGCEIIIPVNRGDLIYFEQKATAIYHWFDLKPITSKQLRYSNPKFDIEGDRYKIYNSRYEGSKAIMGNICYPIDNSHLKSELLNNFAGIFYFDIGELDINIGRESLRYTQKTIDALDDRCEDVASNILKDLKSKILQAGSFVEACKLYTDTSSSITNLVKTPIKFGGRDVKSRFELQNRVSYMTPSAAKRCITNSIYMGTCNFVVNDLRFGFIDAYHNWRNHESPEGNQIYFLEPNNGAEICALLDLNPKELPRLSKYKVKQTRDSRGSNKEKYFRLKMDGYYRETNIDNWSPIKIEFDKGGIYLETNRFATKFKGAFVKPWTIMSTLKIFRNIFPDELTIIGVKSADVGRFKRNPKWIDLEVYMKGMLMKWQKQTEYQKLLRTQKTLNQYLYGAYRYFASHKHKIIDERLKNLSEICASLEGDLADKHKYFQTLAEEFKLDVVEPEIDENLHKLFNEVDSYYRISSFHNVYYDVELLIDMFNRVYLAENQDAQTKKTD